MAIQNYLDTLKKARATGTPGNYAKANTRIPANMQNGVPVYEKQFRGQTMYAPEIFDTARDRESLAKFKTLTPPAPKPANELGGNVIKFGGDFDSNITKTTPAQDLAMSFGNVNNTNTNNTATTNTTTNTNNIIPQVNEASSTTSQDTSYMDTLNSRIKSLQDAINERYNVMREDAQNVSNLNKSNIRGNLGRVFGSNVDTSEAAPITAENVALEGRLRAIESARNEALSNNDMSALDRLQAEQARIQSVQAAQRQQDFNNAIAQAALTGNYGGAKTLDAQQQEYQRALQEAGLTGMYNGTPTLGAISTLGDYQTQLLQRALQEAGVTGMYKGNPTLDALTSMSGITGYYNGTPTLARDQLSINSQQKQINDILDYISSTQNNLNTNQTKLSLADINNQADLQQLLQRLSSQEGIASMNNATKQQQLAINQQRADAYSQRMKELSGKTDNTSLTQKQALDELYKMNKLNSYNESLDMNKPYSDETISLLEEAAGVKKKAPVAAAPSGWLEYLGSLVNSMGQG